MLVGNRVVVLRVVRYRENSLIVNCYGKTNGRLTLLVNNAFSKGKQTGKNVFFQPLSIVDVVYYTRPNSDMHRLKEVSPALPLSSLHHNPVKLAISIFISELIYRTIREEEENAQLFSYLESSIQVLDELHAGVANFHLIFMVHLSRYLGFYPINNWSEAESVFDYKNGKFVAGEPSHGFALGKQVSKLLGDVLKASLFKPDELKLDHKQRVKLIEGITQYYRFHLGAGVNFRTLPILMQLFE